MLECPFTPERKAEMTAAFCKSLEMQGFPGISQVEYLEGPMFDTLRAWRNRKDRRSGDYPEGEWEMRLYPPKGEGDAVDWVARTMADPSFDQAMMILPPR